MRYRSYPKIHIRSKAELARHISDMRLPRQRALKLINNVMDNFDDYWMDHPKHSQPEKQKWVRDASRSDLGKLLKQIDKKVLRPHDPLVPSFIFGGLSGLNHKAAVKHLLGKKRKRVLLKLDISKFFEQITHDRVYSFYLSKTSCGEKGAKLLADLSCVPFGAKNAPADYQTIARGFPTSPRLAVWCNLDTFMKLERLVKKELKGKDPRIAIYVDDIGITASKVTKDEMMRLYPKVKAVLEDGDANQKLPINQKKTRIIDHTGETFDIHGESKGKWGFELLGLQMNPKSLTLGTKTRWKLMNLTQQHQSAKRKNKAIKRTRKSMLQYKNYIEKR